MDDNQIIELYWTRNEAALHETDIKYGKYCFKIADNILSIREDAEECVNDTYYKAWETIPPQHPEKLGAYLGRIVRNLAINLWKNNHTQKRYAGMNLLLDELEECIPGRTSIEDSITEKELTEILNQWLEGLPSGDRILFIKRYWYGESRVAIIIVAFLALSVGTVFAASPTVRKTIINFFTEGKKEKVPYDDIDPDKLHESSTESGDEDQVKTVGDINVSQSRSLNKHVSAFYVSSKKYLDLLHTNDDRLVLYTTEKENAQRTFYKFDGNEIEVINPELHNQTGMVEIKKFPGLYKDETEDYSNIVLPKMSFEVQWQELNNEIVTLPVEDVRFDIGSTYGGSKDGKSIEGMYDGGFVLAELYKNADWISMQFKFDYQQTFYTYPFLFNIKTGEVRDPISNVDLSAYRCIQDLTINSDEKTATAMAGNDKDSLCKICIDLGTGKIKEEKEITPPVSDYYLAVTTSDHTVFYMVGKQENVSGFIYDTVSNKTKEVFNNTAYGYDWNYGFSDKYIRLIGNNCAMYYKEPENEVYLLDLVDGSMSLLDGIPTKQNITFSWNYEGTMLNIQFNEDGGNKKLAFFEKGASSGWYFERELSDDIQETASQWYGSNKYCISATKNDDNYYMYFYQLN